MYYEIKRQPVRFGEIIVDDLPCVFFEDQMRITKRTTQKVVRAVLAAQDKGLNRISYEEGGEF